MRQAVDVAKVLKRVLVCLKMFRARRLDIGEACIGRCSEMRCLYSLVVGFIVVTNR